MWSGPVTHPLVAKLRGTDRRSIGRSEEVVGSVLADPGQFRTFAMGAGRPGRARRADAPLGAAAAGADPHRHARDAQPRPQALARLEQPRLLADLKQGRYLGQLQAA